MKKLLVLLFSILISLNSYAEKLNNLFGMNINDNANKYFSSDFIDSNKYRHKETLDGYFTLNITNQIKQKSPYASKYKINIDSDNRIQGILGFESTSNINTCREIQKDLSNALEVKYQINFESWEDSIPAFKKYQNFYWNTSGGIFSVQCTDSYTDNTSFLQIYMLSLVMQNAMNEYYDSGL